MNKSRLLVGLLLVAVLVMFVPASHAQTGPNCQAAGSTINCNVIAVGSSGIYSSAALASISPDPTRGNAALCGTHFWTGTGLGRDPRKTMVTPNLSDESATIWIAWDNDTTPTIICAYLATDSLVGQRLFFSQGGGASGPTNNGQLILTSGTGSGSACGTAGANKVSFIWDTATGGLPPAIYNALEGTTGTTCPTPGVPVNFTTASTDVDPTDALFVGNQRVLGTNSNSSAGFPADSKTSLGYGGTTQCNGPAIASAYSTGTANGVCYTYVAGQPDPISGTVIPASQIVSEGALVQIPLINITNTTSGGFGDLYTNRGFNNVLSRNIAAGYAFSPYGTATLTRDLFLGPNAGSIPVVVAHYLTREPQSGTYTTFEWQVIRNKETALGGGGLSQETNVCGASQLAFGCAYTTPAANPVQCPAQTSNLTNLTFPVTSSCSNYISWGASGFNALKTRVIGNGEMVNVLNVNASAGGPSGSACTAAVFPGAPCITDTFGYGFWSLGTEGGKSQVRYLQLDGTDGLYSGWTAAAGGNNGAFPVTIPGASGQGKNPLPGPAPADGCAGYFNGNGTTVQTFACNAWNYPTFANVVTGSYRLWNFNRVMWFAPAGGGPLQPNWTALNAPAFWLSAADQAAPVVGPAPLHGTIPDFMPFGYCASAAACPNAAAPTLTYPMTAFRAHYSVPSWGIGNANNGITASGFGGVENGGDVAGATVGVQAEAESVAFFSSSFLSWVQ